MSSNHASREAADKSNAFVSRREAELEAGRKRVEERTKAMVEAGRVEGKHVTRQFKDADRALQEDEERRNALLDTRASFNKVEHDRAGAEVIDQAQTELEAVQHLADRNEPILDYRRERIIEKLEGDADPAAATELTKEVVTAQAVNQPTVIAHEAGQDTENKPLNTSGLRDHEVAMGRMTKPSDKLVPKTRKKAERAAKAKVPDAERVVKEEAVVTQEEPEKNEAVEIVRETPELGGPREA